MYLKEMLDDERTGCASKSSDTWVSGLLVVWVGIALTKMDVNTRKSHGGHHYHKCLRAVKARCHIQPLVTVASTYGLRVWFVSTLVLHDLLISFSLFYLNIYFTLVSRISAHAARIVYFAS